MLSVMFEQLAKSWAFLAHSAFSLIAFVIAVILVARRGQHEIIPQPVVYIGFAMALVSLYGYWASALLYALATVFVVIGNREAGAHAANNSLQARRP
jgi:ABC-type Fe3+-siderophore transport system permease subunit